MLYQVLRTTLFQFQLLKKFIHLIKKSEKFTSAVVILTVFRFEEIDSEKVFNGLREVGHEEGEDEHHLDLSGQARTEAGQKEEDDKRQNKKDVRQTYANWSAYREKIILRKKQKTKNKKLYVT